MSRQAQKCRGRFSRALRLVSTVRLKRAIPATTSVQAPESCRVRKLEADSLRVATELELQHFNLPIAVVFDNYWLFSICMDTFQGTGKVQMSAIWCCCHEQNKATVALVQVRYFSNAADKQHWRSQGLEARRRRARSLSL